MRQLAKDRGEKISEYGVENIETGEILTFDTEEAILCIILIFRLFHLKFVKMEQKWKNMTKRTTHFT